MDKLVKEGIELDHAYSYKFCSPTRSCLQSGRLPVHVNVLNIPPTVWNPADPVSVAVGETVILLHPPLPLVGVSIAIERERHQNDSLADG